MNTYHNERAAPIYKKYQAHPLLRDRFVEQVGQAWGNSDHPFLGRYPNITARQKDITPLEHSRSVKVTELTPRTPLFLDDSLSTCTVAVGWQVYPENTLLGLWTLPRAPISPLLLWIIV